MVWWSIAKQIIKLIYIIYAFIFKKSEYLQFKNFNYLT